MNNFLLIIAFSLFLMNFMPIQNYQDSKEDILINKILHDTSDFIKKKYNLKAAGVGVAMPGGIINEVSLIYSERKEFSQKALRRFLVEFSQELLTRVNSSEEIRPYLINFPLSEKNVKVVIYNNGRDGFELFDPEICVARISKGILRYNTLDPTNTFRYKNEYTETFEEAKKIVLIENLSKE